MERLLKLKKKKLEKYFGKFNILAATILMAYEQKESKIVDG